MKAIRCGALGAAAAVLAASFGASAMTKPKAGLWQQRNESEVNGQDVMAAMAAARRQMMEKMTPEQRAVIEQRFGPADADPHLTQICMTAEQVAQIDNPQDLITQLNEGNDGCRFGDPRGTGDLIKFSGTCSGDSNFNGHMDGLLQIASATAYTMTFSGNGAVQTEKGAVPMQIRGSIAAKWLGDDCGTVQPQR